jgi:hypothetical protein
MLSLYTTGALAGEEISPGLPEVDLGYVKYRGSLHTDVEYVYCHPQVLLLI